MADGKPYSSTVLPYLHIYPERKVRPAISTRSALCGQAAGDKWNMPDRGSKSNIPRCGSSKVKLKDSARVSCQNIRTHHLKHEPYETNGQNMVYMVYGHPSHNRNPYNGYLNPYPWLDDHPLLLETKPCFDSDRADIIHGLTFQALVADT